MITIQHAGPPSQPPRPGHPPTPFPPKSPLFITHHVPTHPLSTARTAPRSSSSNRSNSSSPTSGATWPAARCSQCATSAPATDARRAAHRRGAPELLAQGTARAGARCAACMGRTRHSRRARRTPAMRLRRRRQQQRRKPHAPGLSARLARWFVCPGMEPSLDYNRLVPRSGPAARAWTEGPARSRAGGRSTRVRCGAAGPGYAARACGARAGCQAPAAHAPTAGRRAGRGAIVCGCRPGDAATALLGSLLILFDVQDLLAAHCAQAWGWCEAVVEDGECEGRRG